MIGRNEVLDVKARGVKVEHTCLIPSGNRAGFTAQLRCSAYSVMLIYS